MNIIFTKFDFYHHVKFISPSAQDIWIVKIDAIFIEYLFFWAGTQKIIFNFYTWTSFQLMHYYINLLCANCKCRPGLHSSFPMFEQFYNIKKYKALYNSTRGFTIPLFKNNFVLKQNILWPFNHLFKWNSTRMCISCTRKTKWRHTVYRIFLRKMIDHQGHCSVNRYYNCDTPEIIGVFQETPPECPL